MSEAREIKWGLSGQRAQSEAVLASRSLMNDPEDEGDTASEIKAEVKGQRGRKELKIW